MKLPLALSARSLGLVHRLDRTELLVWASASAAVFALCSWALAVSVWVTPEAVESGAVFVAPPCEYRARTGKPCSTCGLTRGFCAFGHGRFAEAVAYHPATPPLYGVAVGAWAGSAAALWRLGRELRSRRRHPDRDGASAERHPER